MVPSVDDRSPYTSSLGQPVRVPVGTFLFLLPICAAAGPFLLPLNVGVGQLYAFRLIAIIGLPLVFLTRSRQFSNAGPVITPLLISSCGWIIWGIGSLLWSPDPKAGMVELGSIVLGFLATAEIILGTSGRRNLLGLFAWGWTVAFIGVSLIAGWELLTGQHLETSYANAMAARDSSFFVTATFGNPNALGAFLLMSLVVFAWRFVEAKSFVSRIAWLAGITVAPALMLVAGSRTSLVGTVVCSAIFIWAFGTRSQKVWFACLASLSFALGVWGVLRVTGLSLNDLASAWRLGGELQYGGSAGVRLNLFKNGWEMINGTWGFGVGAGGFTYAIEHGYGKFDTAGIVNPHNFWLEISSQYGIAVLLGFCLALAWWAVLLIRSLRHARRCGDRGAQALAATGLAALAAYVIGAGSNSTFIPQPTNWAFLGTLGAIILVGLVEPKGGPIGGANGSSA